MTQYPPVKNKKWPERFTELLKRELLAELALRGCRQADLARVADVTQPAVSLMLSGRAAMSKKIWAAICKLAPEFAETNTTDTTDECEPAT